MRRAPSLAGALVLGAAACALDGPTGDASRPSAPAPAPAAPILDIARGDADASGDAGASADAAASADANPDADANADGGADADASVGAQNDR